MNNKNGLYRRIWLFCDKPRTKDEIDLHIGRDSAASLRGIRSNCQLKKFHGQEMYVRGRVEPSVLTQGGDRRSERVKQEKPDTLLFSTEDKRNALKDTRAITARVPCSVFDLGRVL